MSEVRVLLADDHTLIRSGLRLLVDEIAGFQVVAEAGDGREAVRLVRQLQPDIALLDIGMPGLNGLDATALIAQATPQTHIVILSMYAAEDYVLAALRAGAIGYVAKFAAADELERALRAVLKGEHWLSPSISPHLLDEYLRGSRQPKAPTETETGLGLLTRRQREILKLIAESHSTREIAERLSISIKTAETHRNQLMERLNIHDVASLTRFAIRCGLVDLER